MICASLCHTDGCGTCLTSLWLCCRERKWKIAQAKRFAKLVSKSNLDVEGRERSRRKEDLKKRAAWIAKEVPIPLQQCKDDVALGGLLPVTLGRMQITVGRLRLCSH